MLANERMALLRRESALTQRAPRRGARERLGLWLVSFGFRLAGQCSPPPRQVQSS